MKKVLWVLVLLLGGCSAGMNSSLLKMDMHASLPFLGDDDRQAVVFPYQAPGGDGEFAGQAFGPEWRSVEGDYPEYRFNP